MEFLHWKCEFIFIWCFFFLLSPLKGRWLYSCIRRHLGLYFAQSIFLWRQSLGTVSIELCQSKHEIIQMKSPSPIFSCFSLSDVTANLNCWQHGDWIAWWPFLSCFHQISSSVAIEWWKVTKCIHSNTVLVYNFYVLVLYWSIFMVYSLHFGGKYCTFYLTKTIL